MAQETHSPLQVLKFTGKPRQGAFFFSNPKEILISHKTQEIPSLLERLDRARQAGLHVAGFLAYEALHDLLGLSEDPAHLSQAHFNQKKDKENQSKHTGLTENATEEPSQKDSWPLLAFGLFSKYKFIPQKNIHEFLHGLSVGWQKTHSGLLYGGFLEHSGFVLSEALPEEFGNFRKFYNLQERQLLSVFLKAQEKKAKADFFAALAAIQQELQEGNSYQINYTQKSHFRFLGNPLSLFAYLYRLQPSQEAGLCLFGDKALLSLSPENFLEIRKADCLATKEKAPWNGESSEPLYKISTRPMKGTAARSETPEEDEKRRKSLSLDEKSRAENLMIVDLLRNDLGRIAKIGSISVPSLFEKESHPSLHQMTSRIEAILDKAIYQNFFSKALPALFPCGSITGAPKLSSMQIIGRLEGEGRGPYTGSLGYALTCTKAEPIGNAINFNVLIRSFELDLKTGSAQYGAGCGIVYDSKPEEEWQEYLLKKAFFAPALSHFHLIETMQVTGGKIPLLDLHLARLQEGIHYFRLLEESRISGFLEHVQELLFSFIEKYFEEAPSDTNVSKEFSFTKTFLFKKNHGIAGKKSRPKAQKKGRCQKVGSQRHSLRLCLRRGGEVFLAIRPMPAKRHALRLRLSQTGIYSESPFQRHKTSLRWLYDTALAEARLQGFDDVLFLNENGEVAESAVSNVLFLDDTGAWVSPSVESGALPGVFLRHLCRRHKIHFRSVKLPELLESKRVYLSNALFGLRRVGEIAGK